MEFETRALLYTLLASVVAYAVNGLFSGWSPLFQVPADLPPPTFFEYGWYIVLGMAAGVVAAIVPMVFYGIRDAFHRLPIPPHFKPAIGGLGVGLIALKLPQVLAGGYGWIQQAINGNLTGELMLILMFVQILAFALTISSGGSGGVFRPVCTSARCSADSSPIVSRTDRGICCCGHGLGVRRSRAGADCHAVDGDGDDRRLSSPGRPAALAVVLSFLIQGALARRLKYKSLYEAQVPSLVDSPAHLMDHVEAALLLLRDREMLMPPTVTHLDLRKLLAAGIPVDLPDGKRLMMGMLDPESSYVGKHMAICFPAGRDEDLELIAVFREGHTLPPHTNVRLQAGDTLFVVASAKGQEQLASHLSALAKATDKKLSQGGWSKSPT